MDPDVFERSREMMIKEAEASEESRYLDIVKHIKNEESWEIIKAKCLDEDPKKYLIGGPKFLIEIHALKMNDFK